MVVGVASIEDGPTPGSDEFIGESPDFGGLFRSMSVIIYDLSQAALPQMHRINRDRFEDVEEGLSDIDGG